MGDLEIVVTGVAAAATIGGAAVAARGQPKQQHRCREAQTPRLGTARSWNIYYPSSQIIVGDFRSNNPVSKNRY